MNNNVESKIKLFHIICLVFGMIVFSYSVISAIIFNNNRFYSAFAVGSALILSSVRYIRSGNSILKFFICKAEKTTIFMFLAVSTVSFFAVDYYYGVQLSMMWSWIGYGFIDYVSMFAFMNIAFILSIYELYGIIFKRLGQYIPDKKYFNFTKSKSIRHLILVAGIMCILAPLYIHIFHSDNFIEYAMIFPFFGVLFLTDYISLIVKGDSILQKIFSLNMLYIFSFILTSLVASTVTESVNLFGHEWEYLKMPFIEFRIFTVPVAVFIGWVPLVLAVISIVNLTKNINSKIKNT